MLRVSVIYGASSGPVSVFKKDCMNNESLLWGQEPFDLPGLFLFPGGFCTLLPALQPNSKTI